ncbi:lipopolysaccharide kinase InaA family protein [Pontimicrobium sp. SW4]|uniref:Lipopolysaccharide kinase InaA family protein n=1 Tax=Pontimicrobium sp. SW4 TaxID=3153519 RepID=A0AAU7BUT2_9FLAO
MNKVFHKIYKDLESDIDHFIESFETSGTSIKDKRNKLKLFKLNSVVINIKGFKVPNIINRIVYKFFRKSKAQRSFNYANKLLKLEIGTPQPIAYYEFANNGLFYKSYYVSEQIEYDLTYRELINDFDYPDYENILRDFTKFTFKLHENNIHFLDHSPGNTLIKKENGTYKFYLVDLNRMKFEPMSFNERIKNFARLTEHKAMIEIMSDEYAKCMNAEFNEVFNKMWKYTQEFRQSIQRKKRLKKLVKF